MINGKLHYEIKTVNSTSTSSQSFYLIKEDGKYIVGSKGYNGTPEYILLKDNVQEGATWNNQYNGDDYYTVHTIINKGITKTVRGREFKDVIHVREYSRTVSNPTPTQIQDFYFAKGVGIITVTSDFGKNNSATNIIQITDLVSYTIK